MDQGPYMEVSVAPLCGLLWSFAKEPTAEDLAQLSEVLGVATEALGLEGALTQFFLEQVDLQSPVCTLSYLTVTIQGPK